MNTQLSLFSKRQPTPTDDTRRLLSILSSVDWTTAKQLSPILSWSDRKVREVASGCDEVISYPGSPGYKLLKNCTREEYEHFRNANKKQAREMISRVIRADRKFFAHAT